CCADVEAACHSDPPRGVQWNVGERRILPGLVSLRQGEGQEELLLSDLEILTQSAVLAFWTRVEEVASSCLREGTQGGRRSSSQHVLQV
ncbi:MAG: hypothetical protein ACLP9L_19460, partial [Thermoguttaceae bacterium]